MYRELTIGERLKDMRTNRRLRLEDDTEQARQSLDEAIHFEYGIPPCTRYGYVTSITQKP